ncbi:MAG TPA: DegT/DnrJ/EryC1/StrS aminotransferase family protein, partial [Thermotogales bacterium]|nr:DegT/DnrJ/EryC1/StrS aminotransferase family protein [Thermotogales bacterium]
AIHLQKFYREEFGYSEGFLPITESISKRTLALPFYTDLKEEDQEKVVHKLRRAIELFGR